MMALEVDIVEVFFFFSILWNPTSYSLEKGLC